MNTTLRRQVVAAALLLLPVGAAFVAAPAAAQQMPGANLAIATANLSADYGLKPGSTLKFQVTATAGARSMRVTMGESGVRLSLRETRPGVYEGQHVVTRDERLDPRQLLTVTADYGSGDVARAFYYPSSFQSAPVATTPPPTAVAIERFMLRPGPIESGRPLYYRVTGARGGPGAHRHPRRGEQPRTERDAPRLLRGHLHRAAR